MIDALGLLARFGVLNKRTFAHDHYHGLILAYNKPLNPTCARVNYLKNIISFVLDNLPLYPTLPVVEALAYRFYNHIIERKLVDRAPGVGEPKYFKTVDLDSVEIENVRQTGTNFTPPATQPHGHFWQQQGKAQGCLPGYPCPDG